MSTTPTLFQWDDPFLVELQLTPEERLLRDRIRAFCETTLSPSVTAAFRSGETDPAIYRRLGEAGLLGAMLPKRYGGGGWGAVAYGLMSREVERVDSGWRTLMSAQSALVMGTIHDFGSEEQRQHWLPQLATGACIGCFALTEPENGSDPGPMSTRAAACDGGFRLDGRKVWITSSPIADLLLVWAKTDDGKLRGFLVERGWAGVSTPPTVGKIGLRTAVTGDVILQDVFVPSTHLLPDAIGLKAPLTSLNGARYGIVWGAMGAAEDCWFRTRTYTLQRQQFGRPLAATQLVQRKLADMQTEISLGLQAAVRLGRMWESGLPVAELTSLLKRNASGKALEIARMARDLMGANGMSDEFAVGRHMVNLEAVNTYEGTHDIHALVLGRGQTGLAAF